MLLLLKEAELMKEGGVTLSPLVAGLENITVCLHLFMSKQTMEISENI